MHRIPWLPVRVDQTNLASVRCYWHLRTRLASGIKRAEVVHTECTKPGGRLLLLRLLAKEAGTRSALLLLLRLLRLLLTLWLTEGTRAPKCTSGTRVAYDHTR